MMAVLAEYALTHGHSMETELTKAATALGRPTHPEKQAISRAKAGDLGSALSALKVDPLVIVAATVEPKATLSVSQRLRGLPRFWVLAAPLIVPLLYIMGVSLLQLPIAFLVGGKIDPTFAEIFSQTGQHRTQLIVSQIMGTASRVLPLMVLVGGPLALLALGMRTGKRFLSRFAFFWSIKPARVLAAAAELTRHGVPAERGLAACLWLGGGSEQGLESLSHADLSASSLDELARHLSESAASNARRTLSALRIVGTTIILVIGGCIVGSIYLKLSLVFGVGE